jgi:transposase
MDGVTTTVKAAHVRLCHSRMMLVRAYPRETQEMVFDAHERAFAFFRGACSRGIYDNLWTSPAQGDLLVRRLECSNLSGLLRDDSRPWP